MLTFKTVSRCAWDDDRHLYSIDWCLGQEKWLARYTNLECEDLGSFDSIVAAELACQEHSRVRKAGAA